MKLVIDIPDKYKDNYKTVYNGSKKADEILNAIKNGTVLPKGHGRLFILDEVSLERFFVNFGFSCQKWISEVGISNATLKVIEAESEDIDENS